MAPRLSVAIIVRDEAEMLPEFLESVQGWVDEVCLVDTGSTDATAEIARNRGCRVFSHAWCDDFAAARNESLRLCTGDWILVLDADERIAIQDRAALRALAVDPCDHACRLVTRNYTNASHLSGFVACEPEDPFARGFAGWSPSTKVRLFPNGTGALFEGRIHELVNDSLERQGIHIMTADVPVHHYPLLRSPERLRGKQELYLRLGLRKVETEPGNPQAWVELGRQYVEVGNFGQAAAAYREAARRAPASADVLKELGAVLLLGGRVAEAEKAFVLAVQLAPDLDDAWRNLGILHAGAGRWAEAARCFQRAAELRPDSAELHRALGEALAHARDSK